MVLAPDCEIQGTVNNHTYLAAKQALLKLVQGSCMSADEKSMVVSQPSYRMIS